MHKTPLQALAALIAGLTPSSHAKSLIRKYNFLRIGQNRGSRFGARPALLNFPTELSTRRRAAVQHDPTARPDRLGSHALRAGRPGRSVRIAGSITKSIPP